MRWFLCFDTKYFKALLIAPEIRSTPMTSMFLLRVHLRKYQAWRYPYWFIWCVDNITKAELLFLSERTTFSETAWTSSWFTEIRIAFGTAYAGLSMREKRRYVVTSRTSHVHKVCVGFLQKTLELVLLQLTWAGRV